MKLPEDIRSRILTKALKSRVVDERLLELFSQGKLFGTIHTCIGQELSGAVISEFLKKGDSIFSNHRCHGHFLSWTDDVEGLIAELMGKESGVCGGLGGSQHLCKDGFYSNGIQGSIVPVSLGMAFARKLSKSENVSVVFIGDGTLGEGAVYESFNMAAKWELPLLFVLENNRYSQSTAQSETLAGGILDRAHSFGIRSAQADTWNWDGLSSVAKELIHFVRTKSQPGFIQIDTYRLKAHSKGDDNRSRSEVQEYEEKDPLHQLLKKPDPDFQKIYAEIQNRVTQAIAQAESQPRPTRTQPPASSSNGPRKTLRQTLEWIEVATSPLKAPNVKLVVALNETFKDLMARYPQTLFIGEDVKSPYGGAFKVSKDLSDLFPDRVRNTPISEAAIVGLGCGLALEGFRPFIEIMFGDFLMLAADQLINSAAKFESMYAGKVKLNLVVRTPMGGRRGYGPTHSQSLEKHFLGTPGLRILAVNSLMDPKPIYENLLKTDSGPTLLIENKVLYSSLMRAEMPPGFNLWASSEDFPTLHIKPESHSVDLTLVGYGGMSEILIQAADCLFQDHDLIAQVICPTQLFPFQLEPLLELFNHVPNLLLVEEGQGFASFSSEWVAQLMDPLTHKKSHTQFNIKRVSPPESIIPASGPLEELHLPGVQSVVLQALELMKKGNSPCVRLPLPCSWFRE